MSTSERPRRIHLDTDFAGDPDDACALAMLLGWAGVEVVAITTTADPDGRRAGYAARMLELLGRKDIPLAVGVGVSRTTGREMGGLPDHDRFWGDEPAPPSGWRTSYDAMELLEASVEGGATIVAVGPCSNLAVLEEARPGRLADASIVVMGGWLDPLGDEFPTWGPRRDWNVICDVESAALVADRAGEITWCPIPGAIKAQLRERDLDRLRASGQVGRLLARQSLAHGVDNGLPLLASQHSGLHDDLVNFHWDPVACATALEWAGVTTFDARVSADRGADSMRLVRSAVGRPAKVLLDVDAVAFTEHWLTCVEAAQRRAAQP